jgi:hypothetical protein
MRIFAAGAMLACALVGFARDARAQDPGFAERRTDAGQDIRFEDDPLSGLPLETIGNIFHDFRYTARPALMRPRRTFVPEMLKNVESL